MSQDSTLTFEHACILAECELLQLTALHGLTDGDLGESAVEIAKWSDVWRTGTLIQEPDGEKWAPSTLHVLPGSHLYRCLKEAELNGRVTYTAQDKRFIEIMILDSSSRKASYDACAILLGKLLGQGSEIPPGLAKWGCNHLLGEISRPTTPRSRAQDEELLLKCAVLTVHRLVGLGVQKERNDASEEVSACDAVTQALEKQGVKGFGRDRLRKAYNAWCNTWR